MLTEKKILDLTASKIEISNALFGRAVPVAGKPVVSLKLGNLLDDCLAVLEDNEIDRHRLGH